MNVIVAQLDTLCAHFKKVSSQFSRADSIFINKTSPERNDSPHVRLKISILIIFCSLQQSKPDEKLILKQLSEIKNYFSCDESGRKNSSQTPWIYLTYIYNVLTMAEDLLGPKGLLSGEPKLATSNQHKVVDSILRIILTEAHAIRPLESKIFRPYFCFFFAERGVSVGRG